jgi:hypothetical protein
MEIRIVMDSLDPPAGTARPTGIAGHHRSAEIGFAGWLGLLRAPHQVTGVAGSPGPGAL